MYKLKIMGKEYTYDTPRTLESIKDELNIKDAYCVRLNTRVKELKYVISSDCDVEFLGLNNSETTIMYRNTLRYIIYMALHSINKELCFECNFSVSRGLYFGIKGAKKPITYNFLAVLKQKVDEIIKANYDIKRVTVTKEEAIKIYEELGYTDKIELLKYRPDKTVHLYECNGYYNYMFGYMLPKTSYVKEYQMRLYSPGIIVLYPRSDSDGKIPRFEDDKVFAETLRKANKWGQISKASSITEINKIIENDKDVELINLCETKHNNMLAELGEEIQKDIENIRLIAIAGPSSSGKTTFCNRLRIELLSRGISPIMISIDDYYLPKNEAPRDENGDLDLEHIEALDIDLFNKDMYSLINGEEVTLPHFDFEQGKRVPGKTYKIDENTPIIIEGIHALNDRLTASIPSNQTFKIYIAPHVQLQIDNQNPISMTDIRLIRRIVRDKQFRNCPCEDTLKMWPSVRRGEFRWIYPNQAHANYVYNSELTYELCVLKKYALSQLQEVKEDSEYYTVANRLVKFLKHFKDIDDEWIPCNSLLREFIGKSSFYKK